MNEQFEFLEFGFDSVYVDLKYNEIISLLLLGICACVVCVVMWLSFVYMDAVVAATVMRVLLCVIQRIVDAFANASLKFGLKINIKRQK